MHKITRVGVDLAKNVMQVHAGYAYGIKVANKALKRVFVACKRRISFPDFYTFD
jgi:hypothetical protein